MWKRNKESDKDMTLITVMVKIRVPPGQAAKRERQLRRDFLERGLLKKDKHITIESITEHEDIDPDRDDLLIWNITGPVKSIMDLNKRVVQFETKAKAIVNNKAFKKIGRRLLDNPEDYTLLEEMVSNQTQVEVVRSP